MTQYMPPPPKANQRRLEATTNSQLATFTQIFTLVGYVLGALIIWGVILGMIAAFIGAVIEA